MKKYWKHSIWPALWSYRRTLVVAPQGGCGNTVRSRLIILCHLDGAEGVHRNQPSHLIMSFAIYHISRLSEIFHFQMFAATRRQICLKWSFFFSFFVRIPIERLFGDTIRIPSDCVTNPVPGSQTGWKKVCFEFKLLSKESSQSAVDSENTFYHFFKSWDKSKQTIKH